MDTGQVLTRDSFAWKWKRAPDFGWDKGTAPFLKEWYIKKFGWASEQKLRQFLAKCEFVLDAGCGLGRDVNWYAGFTKGMVYGVDISDSIPMAQERLKDITNIKLIQGDMMDLPFDDGYFDFIACDMALHHTPDSKLAFKYLASKLKKGGQIAIYVYQKKGEAREYADDGISNFTTKMSAEDCLKFAEACALFGRSVAKLNLDLQRFIYWDLFKCFWNDDFDFKSNVMVNFDWYSPAYAWRHTTEEVRAWFNEEKINILHFNVEDAGISARGVK